MNWIELNSSVYTRYIIADLLKQKISPLMQLGELYAQIYQHALIHIFI